MNYFKKKWESFTSKSTLKKAEDILFIVLIVAILVPSTRALIMRGILATGILQPKIEKENLVAVPEKDFSWKFISNGEQKSLQDYKGKVIFLNFWATWCPPCVAELPSIAKLVTTYDSDDDIVFLLVTKEEKSTVDAFLKQQGIELPVSYFSTSPPSSISTNSYPTTLIIDKNGKIVTKKVGAANWHSKKVQKTINTLLKEKVTH